MDETFLKLIKNIKSDSTIYMNPTENNTNKTVYTEAKQTIMAPNQKQREKSLKHGRKKEIPFKEILIQKWPKLSESLQKKNVKKGARKNIGP